MITVPVKGILRIILNATNIPSSRVCIEVVSLLLAKEVVKELIRFFSF